MYRFNKFDRIYNSFKKWILRDNKLMKSCGLGLKEESLRVCLHYLRENQFAGLEEERNAFRDIIELIGQEPSLKIAMIHYMVQHLEQRFFDEA